MNTDNNTIARDKQEFYALLREIKKAAGNFAAQYPQCPPTDVPALIAAFAQQTAVYEKRIMDIARRILSPQYLAEHTAGVAAHNAAFDENAAGKLMAQIEAAADAWDSFAAAEKQWRQKARKAGGRDCAEQLDDLLAQQGRLYYLAAMYTARFWRKCLSGCLKILRTENFKPFRLPEYFQAA